MNKMHSQSSSSVSLQTILVILLLCKCQSSLSYYNNCLTAAHYGCNHTLIPYPFSISEGCGHPGFQLRCENNHTLIKINGGIYRILSGFPAPYSNQPPRITIADENAFGRCADLPNATFNSTSSNFHAAKGKGTEALTLLIDCPPRTIARAGLTNLSQFQCNKKHQCYYACSSYPNVHLLKVPKNCSSVVVVPVSKNNCGANKNQKQPVCYLLLNGFQVEWNTSDDHFHKCKGCLRSKGICGYNDTQPFLCYCWSGVYLQDCHSGGRIGAVHPRRGKSQLGVIIDLPKILPLLRNLVPEIHSGYGSKIDGGCAGSVVLITIAATFMAIYWRKRGRPSDKNLETNESMEVAVSGKSFNLPVFAYHELEVATDFFDARRQLGDGGFGRVYSAKLADGQIVAVKRLFPENARRIEQFVNEIRILSTLCHPNLVRLIGFCQHRQDLLLVYEYVPNGTLADHLYGEKRAQGLGLPWETRLNIALQIAKALEYLHFSVSPPVFHRDIKSSNILLDGDFGVKVADFGLSRLLSPLDATHVSSVPIGTPGYLDPDCSESHHLTDKSDVYSFGVVLFEIISGMKAVDPTRNEREINLACLAVGKIQCGTVYEMVDPSLEIESNPLVHAMVGRVCEVGFGCLASRKEDRPDMMEIVVQLEQINRIGCVSSQSCSSRSGQPQDLID